MLGNVVVVVYHTDVQVAGGSVSKVTHLLVTPRVRREVRAHFGCRGAQGGELEDQVELCGWSKVEQSVHSTHRAAPAP